MTRVSLREVKDFCGGCQQAGVNFVCEERDEMVRDVVQGRRVEQGLCGFAVVEGKQGAMVRESSGEVVFTAIE